MMNNEHLDAGQSKIFLCRFFLLLRIVLLVSSRQLTVFACVQRGSEPPNDDKGSNTNQVSQQAVPCFGDVLAISFHIMNEYKT